MTAITKLQVSNFLRLRTVEVVPAPEGAVVSGNNAQGKSSLLLAIEATLGGKAAVPDQAVHAGADAGWTRVTLDDGLVVERRYTAEGKTTLHVTDADGRKVTSPQGELDAILGALTFEPLRFAGAKPAEQRATLAALIGLDLEAVEAERAQVFSARTAQGREVKRLEAVVASLPVPEPGLPSAKVDMGELLQVLAAARETVAENQRRRAEVEGWRERRADLQRQIDALQAESAALAHQITSAEPAVAALSDPDLADLESQVAGLAETNEKVHAAQERERAVAALAAEAAEQKRLTAELARIDAETAQRISDAALPVDGLALSDDGVLLNGLPFSQASAAESIRVCFAIAAAERPGLNIALIRDGSLLDEESRALILAEAAAAGCQLWLECVGREAGGFVIEDGEVVATPGAGATSVEGATATATATSVEGATATATATSVFGWE